VVEAVRLAEVVEEMTRLLEVSISRKCTLHCTIAPELPLFDADPSQLRQVVMNLILNASEAIGDAQGTISITAGVQECDSAWLSRNFLDESLQEGSYVYLEVTDTGCGMDADVQARIFDPFFTTKFTGRGLGLAAVDGIVRGHRGAIKVRSEPGRGTSFRVLFPARKGDPHVESQPPTGEEVAQSNGQRAVLVIEHDDTVRSLAVAVLQGAGFQVVAAPDGRQGIDAFRDHCNSISVVLLDLTMPRMTGDEAMHELRAIRRSARVILTSGYAESESTRRFADRHLAGFLQKPYTPRDLIDAIGKAALSTNSG
jgi:CheY-like chemotaxis protein/two-component sensor histidine kinase